MPRLSADSRISLRKGGGRTHRIEFVRQPTGRRLWVRRNGKYSTNVAEATARTQPGRADWETFGRAAWLGRETGHNGAHWQSHWHARTRGAKKVGGPRGF